MSAKAFILAVTALAAAGPASWAAHPARVRLAQAEPQFEATEAPEVTLESPQTLDRPAEGAEPPGSGTGPVPPAAESPVPDWWKASQESIAQAMDDQATTNPATPAGSEQTASTRSLGENVLRGFLALCIVVALILLSTYALKRIGGRTPLLAGASLGTVLGRIHLSPKACLHFVRVRNTVLVIGVTPNGMSSIAQLDASLFESKAENSEPAKPSKAANSFLAHLKSGNPPDTDKNADKEDDEIAALRADLARLQQYLQETSRELGE